MWGDRVLVYETPVQPEAVAAVAVLVGETPVVAVDVGVGELALGEVRCTAVHRSQDADDDDVYG